MRIFDGRCWCFAAVRRYWKLLNIDVVVMSSFMPFVVFVYAVPRATQLFPSSRLFLIILFDWFLSTLCATSHFSRCILKVNHHLLCHLLGIVYSLTQAFNAANPLWFHLITCYNKSYSIKISSIQQRLYLNLYPKPLFYWVTSSILQILHQELLSKA